MVVLLHYAVTKRLLFSLQLSFFIIVADTIENGNYLLLQFQSSAVSTRVWFAVPSLVKIGLLLFQNVGDQWQGYSDVKIGEL